MGTRRTMNAELLPSASGPCYGWPSWPIPYCSKFCKRRQSHDLVNLSFSSGPGGRRFKSSRPDHSFQGVISDSWSFIYTTVDKIVDGHILRIQHVGAEAGWCWARFPSSYQLSLSQSVRKEQPLAGEGKRIWRGQIVKKRRFRGIRRWSLPKTLGSP